MRTIGEGRGKVNGNGGSIGWMCMHTLGVFDATNVMRCVMAGSRKN